jgi:hypothetical protein
MAFTEKLLMVQPKHCRIRKFYAGCLVSNAVSNEYRKTAKTACFSGFIGMFARAKD